jgi:hypothetical protein
MALIVCSECGAEISDMAKSCPHCGVPEPKARRKIPPTDFVDSTIGTPTHETAWELKWFLAVIWIFVVLDLVFWEGFNPKVIVGAVFCTGLIGGRLATHSRKINKK